MATIVRIVSVQTRREVSRIELADDGTITYRPDFAGTDHVAQGLVRQRMRVREISAVQAITELAADGWSNGYLMVALDTLA